MKIRVLKNVKNFNGVVQVGSPGLHRNLHSMWNLKLIPDIIADYFISLVCFFIFWVFLINSAFADYTASGRFMYQDMALDLHGFTGARPLRPIRLADVLIMDANTNQVLARGATNSEGRFLIEVKDHQSRDLSIVVVSNSDNTPDLHQAVMVLTDEDFTQSRNGTIPHAFEGLLFKNHDPNQNIDMDDAIAHYRRGGEPFNIYDNLLDNANFLCAVTGACPPANIKTIVNFNIRRTDDFAFYQSRAGNGGGVFLGPTLGYDDTVILHELGHYVEHNYGNFDDNPGGQHFIGDVAQDPRLSWGEGWATFWASHVRNYRGDIHPNVYVNTVGDSTPGVISFSYDLETRTGESASSENAVQSALWDLTDGVATPDFSPGVDDEPGYEMTRDFSEIWRVVNAAMPLITEPRTFEDFYDTWLWIIAEPDSLIFNNMLYYNHNIQYRPDEYEDNNTLLDAHKFTFAEVAGVAPIHCTHFPYQDEDWFVFNAFASVKYSINTFNMRDGADTFLSLFSAAGVELAANDNVGTPQSGNSNAFEVLRSEVEYQPDDNGPLYLRCRRSPVNVYSKYGNYNLRIAALVVGPGAPDIQILPSVLVMTGEAGQIIDTTVVISNRGTQDTLAYEIEEQARDKTPFDFPWLTTITNSGRLAPGDSDTLSIHINCDSAHVGKNIARLEVISNDPNASSRPIALAVTVTQPTLVDNHWVASQTPAAFVLGQNYPNPFFVGANSAYSAQLTQISYAIPAIMNSSMTVKLVIYDVLGRTIRTLVDNARVPGVYQVGWDGRDEGGELVANGIYLYQIQAGQFKASRKLMIIR